MLVGYNDARCWYALCVNKTNSFLTVINVSQTKFSLSIYVYYKHCEAGEKMCMSSKLLCPNVRQPKFWLTVIHKIILSLDFSHIYQLNFKE